MDGFKESFEREERLRDEMLSMYDELMYFKTYVMRENPALFSRHHAPRTQNRRTHNRDPNPNSCNPHGCTHAQAIKVCLRHHQAQRHHAKSATRRRETV